MNIIRNILTICLLSIAIGLTAQMRTKVVIEDIEGNVYEYTSDKLEGIIMEQAPEYEMSTSFLRGRYEEQDLRGCYILEVCSDDLDEYGDPATEGDTYLMLPLIGERTELLNAPVLPTGFYSSTGAMSGRKVDLNRAIARRRIAPGRYGIETYALIEGSVDVRLMEDGVYDIRIEALTHNGTINMRVQANVTFQGGSAPATPLQEDLTGNFDTCRASYYGHWFYPFGDDVHMEFDNDTTHVVLELTTDKNDDEGLPSIAAGSYHPEQRSTIAEYTYLPGRFVPGSEHSGTITGSYVEYLRSDGRTKRSPLTGGSITLDEGGRWQMQLETEYGYKVQGACEGTDVTDLRDFKRRPEGPYSTLSKDRTLRWASVSDMNIYDIGETILDGHRTLLLTIGSENKNSGDLLRMTLIAPKGDTLLPDGKYEIGTMPDNNVMLQGTLDTSRSPLFSWYYDLDTTDNKGVRYIKAPIASGTIEMKTLTTGSRTATIELTDDKGHMISGSFTKL